MLNFLRRAAGAVARRLRCQWAAWHARDSSERALAAGPARRILVVCYGNIYRSPYAAALLRQRLDGLAEVHSGGFHGVSGRPAPEAVVRLAASRGIDLSAHRSAQVSAADFARADLVIVMDRHNWQAVHAAGGAPRIAWLGAMDGGGEIRDPYGHAEDAMRAVMDRVHRCAERLAETLKAHRGSPAA